MLERVTRQRSGFVGDVMQQKALQLPTPNLLNLWIAADLSTSLELINGLPTGTVVDSIVCASSLYWGILLSRKLGEKINLSKQWGVVVKVQYLISDLGIAVHIVFACYADANRQYRINLSSNIRRFSTCKFHLDFTVPPWALISDLKIVFAITMVNK